MSFLVSNEGNDIFCNGGPQLSLLLLPFLGKLLVPIFMQNIYRFFVSHYRFDYSVETGRIFTVLLMVICTLEFITALSAAIFACHFACCDGRSCCGDSQKGNESDIKKNSIKHSRYIEIQGKRCEKSLVFG